MGQSNCCILCIPLETICFVFGILSSVLSVFGLAMLTFAHILGVPGLSGEFYWDDEGNTATFALVIFLYIYCISSLLFSVILSYGAHTRRSGFLKAYLVYGTVVMVLTMTGATIYFCFSWLLDSVGFSVVFVTCCAYSLPLLVVQRTHQQFRDEKALYIVELSEYLEQ